MPFFVLVMYMQSNGCSKIKFSILFFWQACFNKFDIKQLFIFFFRGFLSGDFFMLIYVKMTQSSIMEIYIHLAINCLYP